MGIRQVSTDLFEVADAQPGRSKRRKRGARRPVDSEPQPVERIVRVAGWIPTLLVLGLFAQLCLGGLRPALEERSRLESMERELLERRATLIQEAQGLERLRDAQDDPVYRERLRRRSLDPSFGPSLSAESDSTQH